MTRTAPKTPERLFVEHTAAMGHHRAWARDDSDKAATYARRYLAKAVAIEETLIEMGHRELAGELHAYQEIMGRVDRKFSKTERPDLFDRLHATGRRITALLESERTAGNI